MGFNAITSVSAVRAPVRRVGRTALRESGPDKGADGQSSRRTPGSHDGPGVCFFGRHLSRWPAGTFPAADSFDFSGPSLWKDSGMISGTRLGRRGLMLSAAGLAILPFMSRAKAQSSGSPAPANPGPPSTGSDVVGRRRLGTLDVSSIGIGVQNNSRKYTTETPYRPEQVALLRTAFD